MRFRALDAVAVLAVAAHAIGCHSSSNGPLTPTSSNAVPVKLEVTGPTSVPPDETAQYTATATLSDGSRKDITQQASWTAGPSSVLTISNTGQATGHGRGDAFIQVNSGPQANTCCLARMTVLVLPHDTYRLVGKVLESTLPVGNASVLVLSGTGAGLSATTDASGQYRLYGVAGPIAIKVSKPGYDDIVNTVTVTKNDVLDFPAAHQTAPLPALGGAYTLTLTADAACSGTQGKLPDSLLTPRSYSASIVQDGALLTVTVIDSSILAKENHFPGHVRPDGIDFTIGDGYVGYGFDDGVSEQLSSTQVFTFGGTVQMPKSGSTLVGVLDGSLEVYNLSTTGSYRLDTYCVASHHQFALTRNTQLAGRR